MNIYDPFNLLRTKKESTGKPPGTLAYSGIYADVELKIEAIVYDKDQVDTKFYSDAQELVSLFERAKHDDKVYWINIIGLHNQELIQKVGHALDVHHMDLEDIVHVSQWSKILNQGSYLFSIFKMIHLQNDAIMHEHVSVLMRENIIITLQETPGDVFDYVRNRLTNANGQLRSKSASYLFYALLDAVVDEYIVVVNHISQKFNEIEMQIIDEDNPNKEELYSLRKELLYFSNSLTPLLDSIRKFVSVDNAYFTQDMAPYYSDLHDHLNQVFDAIKAYREMSNSLHEMHMSNVSMRMNRTMMTLTIFSAIFIPLSFLAGVFGMNFADIPGLENPMSFELFVTFCLLLAGGMIGYFKVKNWF